jgi:uncharacterized BrkB/YihY/UPF0761 family membrane protein
MSRSDDHRRATRQAGYQNIGKDRVVARAAGITFYSILALFPAVGAEHSSLLLQDTIDARGVPFVL